MAARRRLARWCAARTARTDGSRRPATRGPPAHGPGTSDRRARMPRQLREYAVRAALRIAAHLVIEARVSLLGSSGRAGTTVCRQLTSLHPDRVSLCPVALDTNSRGWSAAPRSSRRRRESSACLRRQDPQWPWVRINLMATSSASPRCGRTNRTTTRREARCRTTRSPRSSHRRLTAARALADTRPPSERAGSWRVRAARWCARGRDRPHLIDCSGCWLPSRRSSSRSRRPVGSPALPAA